MGRSRRASETLLLSYLLFERENSLLKFELTSGEILLDAVHCNCMTTIWHPPGLEPKAVVRLRKHGFGVGPWPIERLPNLDFCHGRGILSFPKRRSDHLNGPCGFSYRGRETFLVELEATETLSVVEAMRDGAFDVLEAGEPRWEKAVASAVDNQKLWLQLYSGQVPATDGRMVGRSSPFQQLQRDLERLGPTDVTVLLLGNLGLARNASRRRSRGGPGTDGVPELCRAPKGLA